MTNTHPFWYILAISMNHVSCQLRKLRVLILTIVLCLNTLSPRRPQLHHLSPSFGIDVRS